MGGAHRQHGRVAGRALAVLIAFAVVVVVIAVSRGLGSPGRSRGTDAGAGRAAGTSGPSATPPPPPGTFTLAATGDLLIHTAVADRARADARLAGERGYDFRPMLGAVRAQLSAAGLAVCHLETPLTATDTAVSGYPVFNTPWELAPAARWAGYDGCSTGSNHSYDQGMRGVADTLDVLDRTGLAHAGTARSPAEAARIETHVVNGTRVALLDYTFGLNAGNAHGAPPSWAVNIIDPDRILRDAAAARRAGAGLVVVQLHWGQEYRVAPTPEQRALAARLLASPDVDLIVGGHVHVVQPVERIGGKYVVYGVGNFLSNQSPDCCVAASEDGVIVTASVRRVGGRERITGITYTPTWVHIGDYRVLPVAATLDDPRTRASLRPALLASWRRTVAAMTMLGPAAGDVRPDRAPRGVGAG